MSKTLRKTVSIATSLTTILWISGVAILAPMTATAETIVDGDLVKTADDFDVYIVKLVGSKSFKRLILNPDIFNQYGHLKWENIKTVDQATIDSYTTSDLVRAIDDTKVYQLTSEPGADTGVKHWMNMTAENFTAEGYDWDSIYIINNFERDSYATGADITVDGVTPPDESIGTLSVTLASDTPAAGVTVANAARVPYTRINLTATGGDVVVDTVLVERMGLGQDGAFSSLDLVDAATDTPINNTSKTLNSVHQANFTDDFTVSNGTTKSIILAANMASSLVSYAGEAPALALAGITVKSPATVSVSLPITGNTQTNNSTITIGIATVQRGAYSNASSTSIQVGKTDYTYLAFQIAAGSAEKVEFKQVKIYQSGSASLGTDLTNLELLQDGTKIADGTINSSKYATFSFTPITIDKGQIAQFQVRADVEDGSARTIKLGVYKTTDLLVKGLTYGYNITPTYSGTGVNPTSPILEDNEFTISDGTVLVTRDNSVGAGNIGVSNDQALGAFKFTVKGEPVTVSALTLTVASTGTGGQIEDALTGVELVDPNGNVVAGPTDITDNALTVSWTDSFTVPVGDTIYKVRGDLATNGGWVSNDTITVSFTPSAMTITGDVTGNTITATPSSSLSANTQTVKAVSLTVTRNTLPADQYIIVGQQNVTLSSWTFDASASGEDIRVTSILWAGKGQAATNTDALTTYVDGVAKTPVSDALSSTNTSSSFAFDDPIIITKGTSVVVELHGNKNSTDSNDTEQWGLTDATASVVAYGVSTGNTVAETITADDGPTLTSTPKGTLTVETESNPVSAIVLAGQSGVTFSNVKLTAKYEDLRVDRLIVVSGDGSYSFNAADGEYRDVTKVYVYDGTTKKAEGVIPTTNNVTFNFDAGVITVPKGGSKTLTIKADMSTIDPDTDNAPGTNSADLKLGFGGANGIKTTGLSSNSEITGSSYETYRDSTSSAMILRSAKPIVTLPTSSASLGAATALTNGSVCMYAFKVTADSGGSDVLLYRTTFVFATSGSGMTVTSVYVKDQNGNTIKSVDNPTVADNNESYYTTVFNNPDFSNGDDKEAIIIPKGESRTFSVCGTVAGAGTGENLSTFIIGDTASISSTVNSENDADSFGTPAYDFASQVGNFIWSDNYKQYSVTGDSNATSAPQWYNGHLVPGLGNVVSTTPYVIGWSG